MEVYPKRVVVISEGGVIQSVLGDPGVVIAVFDADELEEDENYVTEFQIADGPVGAADEVVRGTITNWAEMSGLEESQ